MPPSSDRARAPSSPRTQAKLLNEALAQADAAQVARALGLLARARGMTGVARRARVSREGLYTSLSADGDPRLTTVLNVLRALGLTLTARAAPED